MMNSKSNCLLALLLIGLGTSTLGQYPLHLDTSADLDGHPEWRLDCPNGYSHNASDYNCTLGGAVDLPQEELREDQLGFWTACEVFSCRIGYYAQRSRGDTTFAARVYQRNASTTMSFNGVDLERIDGEGWVDIHRPILEDGLITLYMNHRSESTFTLLDRIAINAELPPLPPPANGTWAQA